VNQDKPDKGDKSPPEPKDKGGKEPSGPPAVPAKDTPRSTKESPAQKDPSGSSSADRQRGSAEKYDPFDVTGKVAELQRMADRMEKYAVEKGLSKGYGLRDWFNTRVGLEQFLKENSFGAQNLSSGGTGNKYTLFERASGDLSSLRDFHLGPDPVSLGEFKVPDYMMLQLFAMEHHMIVTSTTGGRHKVGSSHYLQKAIDVWSPDMKSPDLWAASTTEFMAAARSLGVHIFDERIEPPKSVSPEWHGPHLHISTPATPRGSSPATRPGRGSEMRTPGPDKIRIRLP
jgi:hypothetical protein